MNIPSSQAIQDLRSYFAHHPLGGCDLAFLDNYCLKDFDQAQSAFDKLFFYGCPYPECIQVKPDAQIFLGEASPVISPKEIDELAAVGIDQKIFLIENQVASSIAIIQPPILLQFDNLIEMRALLDSEGVICKKLTDFLVGEYFFFSADGAIAKYAAYDQIEPVTALIVEKALVQRLKPWTSELIRDSW
jgi:hypothetical protein